MTNAILSPSHDNRNSDEDNSFGDMRQPGRNEGTERPDEGAPDPFDVNRLRLAANDTEGFGVQEVLLRVPYRKPGKESFFRVHPDAGFRLERCGVIELKEDDAQTYWVDPSLWSALAAEPTFGYRAVFTAVTVQMQVFLWGCRLPGSDGKLPPWVTIPLEAAEIAKKNWVKLFWDQTLRQHRVLTAPGIKVEPQWPKQSLKELVKLAFKDSVITSEDHPVLRKLRGEV